MRNKEYVIRRLEETVTLTNTSIAGLERSVITPKDLFDKLKKIQQNLEDIQTTINRE